MIHSLSEYHSITDHLDLHLFSSIENHVKSPLTQDDVFYQLKANDVCPLHLNNHRLSIKIYKQKQFSHRTSFIVFVSRFFIKKIMIVVDIDLQQQPT